LAIQELVGQGAPLGMFAGETWPAQTTQLDPGDVLVLYTDGITEARNAQKEFFGEERLLETAYAYRGECARDIQAAIMGGIDAFVGDSIRSDDITLAVLVRNS
jgi:sigma-B regulation protein RsbU (phosphoserine phosphatase)